MRIHTATSSGIDISYRCVWKKTNKKRKRICDGKGCNLRFGIEILYMIRFRNQNYTVRNQNRKIGFVFLDI